MVHFPYEENLLKRYVFKYLLGLFYKVASFSRLLLQCINIDLLEEVAFPSEIISNYHLSILFL